jgi:hypothetical protein
MQDNLLLALISTAPGHPLSEVIGHTGMSDYVEFVAEYGPFDLYALDDLCRAAEFLTCPV